MKRVFVSFVLVFALQGSSWSQAPEAIPVVRISLQQALEQAVKNSPRLQRLSHLNLASGADLKRAESGLFPQILLESVSKTGPPGAPNFRLPGLANAGFADSAGLDLALTQSFDFGRTQSQIAGRRSLVDASQFQLDGARRKLLWDVERNYLQLQSAQEALSLAERAVASRKQMLTWAEARFSKGMVSRVDARVAGAELAKAEAFQCQVKTQISLYRASLWNEIGLDQPSNWDVVPLEILPPNPIEGKPGQVSQWQTRPELAEALAVSQAAKARLEEAQSAYHPTVSVYASVGYQANLQQNSDSVYAVGVGVSMPLYSGGALEADLEKAKQLELAAMAAELEARRKIEFEVTQARLNLDLMSQLVPSALKEQEQAQDGVRLARLRYSNGLGSISELHQAELLWLQAEKQVLECRTNLALAYAQWNYARGEEKR